jgi:hypothetical protein
VLSILSFSHEWFKLSSSVTSRLIENSLDYTLILVERLKYRVKQKAIGQKPSKTRDMISSSDAGILDFSRVVSVVLKFVFLPSIDLIKIHLLIPVLVYPADRARQVLSWFTLDLLWSASWANRTLTYPTSHVFVFSSCYPKRSCTICYQFPEELNGESNEQND